METKILTPKEIDQAASLIKKGELVAFPTETVYGLGGDATKAETVANVYKAKGRPSDNPLIIHLAEKEELFRYITAYPAFLPQLLDQFWPGSLTVILPLKKNSFPSIVTGGLRTAGFRIPNHPLALQLIRKAETPLVGPSANTSGRPSPTNAAHVFHDLHGKIAAIVDGGPCTVGVESTVLDLSNTEEAPTILRPGAVTLLDLQKVMGHVVLDPHLKNENEQPKAPGMKYQHYAPKATVMMISYQKQNWWEAIKWATAQHLKIGILGDQTIIEKYQDYVQQTFQLTSENKIEGALQQLFAGLRKLDEKNVAIIFVQTFPAKGLGEAFMNRLRKAANGKIFEK